MAVPRADLTDDFDASGDQRVACCGDIVDLEGNRRRRVLRLAAAVLTEDLNLIAVARSKDRLILALGFDLQPSTSVNNACCRHIGRCRSRPS